MAELRRDGSASLVFDHSEARDGKPTLVFVNPLTGNAASWQAEIAPALRDEGFGTLVYDMRGQGETGYVAGTVLDEELIVSDLVALVEHVAPARPVFVGLSIGGLFAARAIERGLDATGLVLINTLRKSSLALDWTNEAVCRLARLGGGRLLMDANLPFLVGPAMLERMRPNCLDDSPYEPMSDNEATVNLLLNARAVDWDFPYESLRMPVLVMTGPHDRVFYKPADVAELMARIPNAREEVFADCGHLIPMENGQATTDALRRFAGAL